MQMKQAELQLKAQQVQASAQLDAERVKIEQQELQMEAEKSGVQLAADRRRDSNKIDLELAKLTSGKNNRK